MRAWGRLVVAVIGLFALVVGPAGADPTPAPTPDPTPATTSAAAAPAAASAVAIDVSRPLRLEPLHRSEHAGFRMEGAAELALSVGDSATLRTHVDRFYALHDRLDEIRREVSRHAAAVLSTLPENGRYCPEEVAVPYFRASQAGQSYETLGGQLEHSYRILRALDELGESAGLTPDYRWKIERAHELYQAVLVDYAEMRVMMGSALQSELRFRRCSVPALLRQGAAQAPGEIAVTAPLAAARVTFFVDNRSCPARFQLYLDGAPVGAVEGRDKAAFQADAGRHELCLLAPGNEVRCGEPGTVRVAYVYESWSMTTHCR
ncbi:hypothetical protein [Haliangium sp.]|uniref:hypothetical protein n=1 Tax=Haliangium sp. TaxID=2663208 RepID=UPI003D13F40F